MACSRWTIPSAPLCGMKSATSGPTTRKEAAMASMTEKRKLQQELAAEGYVVSITAWPHKATFYKPDGEAMPNLPADPYSMANYMKRGFTPFPPKQPVATVAVPDTIAAPRVEPVADPVPEPRRARKQRSEEHTSE